MARVTWEVRDKGTDFERYVTATNGFTCEVWYDDTTPGEEPSWCFLVKDNTGAEVNEDTADSKQEAMELALNNARPDEVRPAVPAPEAHCQYCGTVLKDGDRGLGACAPCWNRHCV